MVKRKADDGDAADALASAAAEAALLASAPAAESQSGSVTVGSGAGDLPMPALNATGAVPRDAAATDLIIAEAAAANAARQEEAERVAAEAMARGDDLQPKKRQRMSWLGEFAYMYRSVGCLCIFELCLVATDGLSCMYCWAVGG